MRYPQRSVSALLLLIGFGPVATPVQSQEELQGLFEAKCWDCHSSEDAEAGVDLKKLLSPHDGSSTSVAEDEVAQWVTVKRVIEQGRMPPESEAALTEDEREVFQTWFREHLVYQNGRPHIGTTPLRRLTHYEFLNALEDLLQVSMRAEYNILSSVNIERSFAEKILPVEVPGESGFVNDAFAQRQQPIPLLEYMKCIDTALSKVTRTPQHLRNAFGIESPPDPSSSSLVQPMAKAWIERAFRKPASEEQLQTAVQVYQQATIDSDAFNGLKAMAKWSLLQPEFFYRMEETKGQSQPYRVNDYELATRLSLFLNGSIPDATLLELAQQKKLSQPHILSEQIDRLMNEPRRLSLSEQFAAQWLGFNQLLEEQQTGELGIPTTNRAQYDELLFFFDELFRANHSLLDIVQSDWIFVSRYSGYDKGQFKKGVRAEGGFADHLSARSLTGPQRRGIENIYDPPTLQTVSGERYGGVISSAAIMRITSAPERTSPVRRGVWLLDRMLGESLEAPKNVPPLDNAKGSVPKENPTKRELLAAHTEMVSCQHCHKTIDPIGFGLENFDPAGKWRTQYPDKTEINSGGVLPGGKAFTSPMELKQQLRETYREPIVRNFIAKLLSYAIGRPLQPYDQPTLESIYRTAVNNDYRSTAILREIVMSPQFLCRQDELE